MFNLKRSFYILTGVLTHLLILPLIYAIVSKNNPPGIGPIIGNIIIFLLILALYEFILHCLSYWHREDDSVIFYYFFKTIKRNSKIVKHEHLGDFLLTISMNSNSNPVVFYNQNWLGCEIIGEWSIYEDLTTNINKRLDNIYKQKLYDIDQQKRENAKISEIMKWDGHLNKVTRRDEKLDKLGIK